MAQSYVTTSGTLVIPSAVASIQVATGTGGLATTGVVMLVGEAAAGPDYTIEVANAGLQNNAYGPGQGALVAAKYGSGNLVDAFNAVAQPANDPNIQGSPQSIIICKTNPSTKAQSNLLAWGGGTYGILADASYGPNGNTTYFSVATPGALGSTYAVAEVVPSTGAFTMALPIGTVNYSIRANGGAALTSGTLSALTTPTAFVNDLNDLAGTPVSASGGQSILPLTNTTGSLVLQVVSGYAVTITAGSQVWLNALPVGATLYIPTTAGLATGGDGGNAANAGSYVVTQASAVGGTVIYCTKVQNATGTIGACTQPVNVTDTVIVSASTDLQGFAPITVALTAANPSAGLGKTLAIEALATGTDILTNQLYTLVSGVPTAVTFLSTAALPTSIVSSAEQVAELDTNNQISNISEQLYAGGRVGLQIQYAGTTASINWNGTSFTLTAVGGSGAGAVLAAAQYTTIGNLAAKINSLTGWTAQAGSGILAQLPSTALDQGTYQCAATQAAVTVLVNGVTTTVAEYTGRIKVDAYDFFNEIAGTSVLVQLDTAVWTSTSVPAQAPAGLPEPQGVTFLGALVSGAVGGTTGAIVVSALAALELCQGNFVVTLMSRNATTDITAGLTDPSSTYQLAAVNLALRTHVLKMAQLKRKRNRQGFASVKDTFLNAQAAASNIASFRVSMCFQDVKTLSTTGAIVQFQPWMGACIAAGMQAAAFYKGIVQKYANISGALQAAGDFSDQSDDQMEVALEAGLLPLRMAQTGGWYWVSDQTTYGQDNNFVFNSIQATYVADIIALTTAMRMQLAFVGQSVADISASLAVSFIEGIMSQLLALKLIAASSDAPNGYKNIVVQLAGTALICSLEVKLAGLVYFVPIAFLVSQVTQSATS